MRENKVKRLLREGKVVIGTMVTEVRSPSITQMLSTAGFDCMFIDSEHSSFSIETVADLILAAKAADIVSVVRVPSRKEHHLMSRPLDAGAQGLLIPRVETKEEVREIIRATKYYPLGERGMSLRRAPHDFAKGEATELMKTANEETLIVIQIESKLAVESIDQLISIEGVDAALIGPNDLSQSLGIPGQMEKPEFIESIRKVIKACEKYDIISGIHVGSTEAAKKWIEEGMKLVLVSTDVGMIVDTGTRLAHEMKDFVRGR